jgi:hypothetical protein
VTDQDGLDVSGGTADCLVRRRVSLWDTEEPKDHRLLSAYRYWESLRPDGLVPSRSKFELERLRSIMSTTSLIDVSPEDPLDYTIRIVGSDLPRTMNLPKQRLGQVRSTPFREMLTNDYRMCQLSGVPAYHEIVARIDYVQTCYARLILPFARNRRDVDELMVCSVYATLPNLVKRLERIALG